MPDEPTIDVTTVDSSLPEGGLASESLASEFAPRRFRSGEVLSGRFVIERLAGSGAMGAVYRALDRVTGAPVAVKVIAEPCRGEIVVWRGVLGRYDEKGSMRLSERGRSSPAAGARAGLCASGHLARPVVSQVKSLPTSVRRRRCYPQVP